jgi:hypothetical protein
MIERRQTVAENGYSFAVNMPFALNDTPKIPAPIAAVSFL